MMQLSGTVLYDAEAVRRRVRELAVTIRESHGNGRLTVVGVLKGSVVFLADLIRELEGPVECDFVAARTDVDGAEVNRITYRCNIDLEGRDVVLVEGVLETGITHDYVRSHLQRRRPRSLTSCVLVDKPERRRADVVADHAAFRVPDRFVVGYGLDYREQYRNLPFLTYVE